MHPGSSPVPAADRFRVRRLGLALALAAGCAAAARAAPVREVEAPADAMGWLARIKSASSTTSFAGTFVVTARGVASSSRILHVSQERQVYELVEALDGPPRQVLRHNDVVRTVWPESRTVLVERRQHDVSFPFLLRASSERLTELYDVRTSGGDRVAGRDAVVLTLSPRDSLRHGYRLWSDTRTGLLLRADILGPGEQVLESSAFSQVAIGTNPQPAEVLRAMARTHGYQVVQASYTPVELRAEGWLFQPTAGFRQVSCVRRPRVTTGVRGVGAATEGEVPSMVQAVYSDGLSSVSVFIEPFAKDRHLRAGTATSGALSTLMQRREDWWVTYVGDVPPATLERFAAALRRAPP